MLSDATHAAAIGLDAVALKPTECTLRDGTALGVETITIDYEGSGSVPDRETLEALADEATVYLTTPVRADGYDPLGDDSLLAEVPTSVGRVLVAGHSAYLSDDEQARAIAPRLAAAAETATDPWVGTEGIERLALAAGGTQYELLSRNTEGAVRGLRETGYEGDIAVYAPTVVTDDGDAILDAVGAYVARRRPVARALPDDAATDAAATDRARDVLLAAADDFALVGDRDAVRSRIETLRTAGVDTVVGYPARGIDAIRG